MSDPFQLNVLDPADTRFFRTTGGMLAMKDKGIDYPVVTLRRTFPYVHSNLYLSVRNSNGEELGILENADELDEESRSAVDTELRLIYLTPRVTRIDQIKHNAGIWLWEVQTTKGPMRLVMRNLHEHMQTPAAGRILITDMEGIRVEIVNYLELDPRSRKRLDRIL